MDRGARHREKLDCRTAVLHTAVLRGAEWAESVVWGAYPLPVRRIHDQDTETSCPEVRWLSRYCPEYIANFERVWNEVDTSSAANFDHNRGLTTKVLEFFDAHLGSREIPLEPRHHRAVERSFLEFHALCGHNILGPERVQTRSYKEILDLLKNHPRETPVD